MIGTTVEQSRSIHVLVVDSDPAWAGTVARGLRRRGGIRVSVVSTLGAARTVLRSQEPTIDVVILELRLPDGHGATLLRDIETRRRQPSVIIVSECLRDLDTSALAYRPIVVSKPVSVSTLLSMVRIAAAGYARPTLERFVVAFGLRKRETEAVVLIAQGLLPKEIADRMSCTEQTVYGHLTRACKKVGCSHYHEVVAKLFAFACQAAGHTPPDHAAIVECGSCDDAMSAEASPPKIVRQTKALC